jgi:hypothetical protein
MLSWIPREWSPAAEDGAAPGTIPGLVTKFKKDDIVVGKACKGQKFWDQKKCKILAVQSKHYKVEMIEGAKSGIVHKYLHACVEALDPEQPVTTPIEDMLGEDEANGAGATVPEATWHAFSFN